MNTSNLDKNNIQPCLQRLQTTNLWELNKCKYYLETLEIDKFRGVKIKLVNKGFEHTYGHTFNHDKRIKIRPFIVLWWILCILMSNNLLNRVLQLSSAKLFATHVWFWYSSIYNKTFPGQYMNLNAWIKSNINILGFINLQIFFDYDEEETRFLFYKLHTSRELI